MKKKLFKTLSIACLLSLTLSYAFANTSSTSNPSESSGTDDPKPWYIVLSKDTDDPKPWP